MLADDAQISARFLKTPMRRLAALEAIRLLRLKPTLLDDAPPGLGVGVFAAGQLDGGHEAHRQAHGGERVADFGHSQHLGQRIGESVDDCFGRAGWRKKAVVGHVLKTGQPQFGEGGYIG